MTIKETSLRIEADTQESRMKAYDTYVLDSFIQKSG